MEKTNSRYKVPFDYVAQARNLNEVSEKTKITQIRWHHQYQWLCDEYIKVEEEMRKLNAEKCAAVEHVELKTDDRSAKPIPKTTNSLYGWLALKNEFNLEKYGSYIVKYPNPLNEVTLLKGNVPTLAGGKGLI